MSRRERSRGAPGAGDGLRQTLARVAGRRRLNRTLQALTTGAAIGLGLLAAVSIVGAVSGRSAIPARTSVFLVATVVALCVGARAFRRERPEDVASAIDERLGLQDEIRSAWWFISSGALDAWRDLQVRRATANAPEAGVVARFPVRRPRKLAWAGGMATLLALCVMLPLGDVIDLSRDDLAAAATIDEMGAPGDLRDAQAPEDDILAAMEEPIDPDADSPWDRELEPDEGETPEDAEQSDEGAEAEEGATEESGEPTGETAASEDQTGTDESTEESPEAEDSERSAGGRPRPEDQEAPADAAPLVPASDEVFLQEAAAPPETSEDSEENAGHATATPDGGQELPEGEVTRLDVQLEMEMLEAARLELEREEEEEPVEEITRQERSTVEFSSAGVRSEFDEAEIVDRDVIEWPYRELVLEYFRTIRAREKADYERRRAERERERDRAPTDEGDPGREAGG